MKVLALDYGKRKTGVAVGFRGVIETRPLIKAQGDKLLAAIKQRVEEEGVELVVVGVSEGKQGEESRRFAKHLAKIVKLPVKLVDETLTTHEAREKKGGKRKEVDSVAAALILERFFNQLKES